VDGVSSLPPIGEQFRSVVGDPAESVLIDSSPRSRVWRVDVHGALPVIVKQILKGSDNPADADARYRRELTALRLAGRATEPAVAPMVLTADATSRTMVLQYLEGVGVVDEWLPGYAESLARLHSLTGPADAGTLPGWRGPTPADVESFLSLARTLDVPVRSRVWNELGGLIGRLDPTAHHALLHGDPCPGNDVHTSSGVQFVDFEQASIGNGLVELAYLRIGFPTCWCAMSVANAQLIEAENVYRSTWRDLTGTEVPGDLADACAGWLIRGDALVEKAHRQTIDHLARLTSEDFMWGYVSARERLLHRLDVVASMANDHDRLHEFGRLCTAMAGRLRQRWPNLRSLPTPDTRPWP
jgi:tRNA A-37 threonylcarbamoyl transferase component Bud32